MSQRSILNAFNNEELLEDLSNPFGDPTSQPTGDWYAFVDPFSLAPLDSSAFPLQTYNYPDPLFELSDEKDIFPEQFTTPSSPTNKKKYRYYRRKDVVQVDDRVLTFDALIKRRMKFTDTKEEVSKEDKKKIAIINGQCFIDGREIEIIKNRLPSRITVESGIISKEAFLKRRYQFEETGEIVSREDLKKATFFPYGIYVDGLRIVYKSKSPKRKNAAINNIKEEPKPFVIIDTQSPGFRFFNPPIYGYIHGNETESQEVMHPRKRYRGSTPYKYKR